MTPDDAPPPPPTSARPRRRWIVGAALAAVGILAVGGLTLGEGRTRSDGPGPDRPGPPARQAPPIDLPALNGEGRVSLESFRGRPLVVNLFASWCVPCRKELPAFRAVSEQLGGKVAFLGINHQDNRRSGQDMLAEFGIRYPAGYDPEAKVAGDYALIGMPSTLFVSPDGRLLETHTGEMNRRQLEEDISRLFGI